jgi:subtilisin family serine protease
VPRWRLKFIGASKGAFMPVAKTPISKFLRARRISRWFILIVSVLLLPIAAFAVIETVLAQGKREPGQSDPGLSSLGSDQEYKIQTDKLKARVRQTVQVLIELTDEPAALVYAKELARPDTPKDQAKAQAISAGKAQASLIRATQRTLGAIVTGPNFGAREIYRVQKVLNGIAVEIDANKVDALRQLPGVKAVHTIELEYPTTAISMPFLGVPNLWDNGLGLGQNITGTGVKIGIIDTGTGIASGLGVTSGGATYTGPYGSSTPFGSLRIGPGAAPGASLYAIRVFGCSGSTGLQRECGRCPAWVGDSLRLWR